MKSAPQGPSLAQIMEYVGRYTVDDSHHLEFPIICAGRRERKHAERPDGPSSVIRLRGIGRGVGKQLYVLI